MDGFELINLKRISLKVHRSWGLILIFFTLACQGQFERVFGDQFPIWHGWIVGLLTSFFLFLSVLLHEFGHYFVALNEGVEIRHITVSFLGGAASLVNQCSKAMSVFRIAIAGPLVSILLGVFCFLYVQFGMNPVLINLSAQIGSINLVLALFNLLPCLPLNGGVIVKSLIWQCTGDQTKAHRTANYIGRSLSLLVILVGVLITFSAGGLNGLWLIILGWVGLTSSRSQNQLMILQQHLYDLKVGQAARKRLKVFEQDQPLKVLNEIPLVKSQNDNVADWVFLCSSGRWVGYVTNQLLKDIPVKFWEDYPLSSYIKPLSDLPSISERSPIWHAVLRLQKEQRLLVLNYAGLPSGIIDKVDLAQIVLKKLGFNLPKNFLDEARKNDIYPLGISLVKIVNGMISSGLIQKSELDKFNE